MDQSTPPSNKVQITNNEMTDTSEGSSMVLQMDQSTPPSNTVQITNNEMTDTSEGSSMPNENPAASTGRDYANLIVANLILKLITDDNVIDFRLSLNKNSGVFDIVLELELKNEHKEKYFMKLKYESDSKSVLLKNNLTDKDKNFDIMNYFECHKKSSDSKLILFTNQKFVLHNPFNISRKRRKSIVSSDKKISLGDENDENKKLKDAITESTPETLLNTASKVGRCYKFDDGVFLYSNQLNVDNIKKDISTRFQKMFCCNENIYDEFLKWTITEGKRTEFNKLNMKRAVGLILLHPFIKTLSFGEPINYKLSFLREAISTFQITFVKVSDYDKVKKFWGSILNKADQLNSYKLLWLKGKCPLIVKEHQSTYKAISLCQNLKFIILVKDPSMINSEHFSTFRDLSDLETKSSALYEHVLKTFECSLQGKDNITLQTLIEVNKEIRYIVTPSDLVQMLDKPLLIGGEREILPKPYIERMLSMNIIDYRYLNRPNKNTLIVIAGLKNLDKFKGYFSNFNIVKIADFLNSEEATESRENDIYIGEEACSSEQFDEICNKISNKTKHHLFRIVDDGKLQWVRSKGSIDDLEEFRLQNQFIQESKLCSDESNSINIICAGPGMGKSSLMKNLKNNCFPNFWPILIRPKAHSKYFRKKKHDADEFIKYLTNEISKKQTDFDSKLFYLLRGQGRIAYFWDGLDEISAENLMIVMKIIDGLAEKGPKQWIASRCSLKETLENKFSVLSRTIKEFDGDERKNYIKTRLNVVPEPALEDILTKINNHIKQFRRNDILNSLLHLFMFTELFRQDPKKYYDFLKTEVSIIDLFNNLVYEKFKFNEKPDDRDDYEKAAMKIYFNRKILREFNINCEKFLREIGETNDPVGLITDVTQDKIPNFVHNSYGEYFAASYLAKNSQEMSKLIDFIFENRFNNIRFMFDLMLAKNCPAHVAVLYKNMELLEKHKDQIKNKDQGGRNPLHLACSWGQRYPLLDTQQAGSLFRKKYIVDDVNARSVKNEDLEYRQILELLVSKCDPNETDKLFNLNSFRYADRALCLLPFEILCNKHKINFYQLKNFKDIATVLYYSAKFDFSNIFGLIGKIPFIRTENSPHAVLYMIALHGSVNCLKHIMNNKNKYTKTINEVVDDANNDYMIHVACRRQHVDIVKVLISDNNNINVGNSHDERPIHIGCINGNLEIVKLLINAEANVNVTNKQGEMPIHLAYRYGYHEIVNLLIDFEADVNAANKDGETLLHTACQLKDYEMVKLLINSKASIDAVNKNGESPIHIACRLGYCEIVRSLLASKANIIDAAGKDGEAPIHTACLLENYDLVRLLINYNVDVNALTKNGEMPIHIACRLGNYEIVKLLLIDTKVDINAVVKNDETSIPLEGHEIVESLFDNKSETPLHTVCRLGHNEIVKLLIDSNIDYDIEAVNADKETPIHTACRFKNCEIVKLLIDKKAKIDTVNKDGETPIHTACRLEQYEIVKLLVDHDVKVNTTNKDNKRPIVNTANKDNERPIHIATRLGHYEIVKLLIDHHADVNIANKAGESPIHEVCLYGNYKIIELLINKRAKIDNFNKNGEMPLHTSCRFGNYKIVKLLIDKGADVDATNKDSETPIHIACRHKHYEIIKLLIDRKAKIDVVDKDGEKPVHRACRLGNYKIVQLFIDHKVDINDVNEDGETLMHTACRHGQHEIVELLIGANAKRDLIDKNGDTPAHLASRMKNYEIFLLLSGESKGPEAKKKFLSLRKQKQKQKQEEKLESEI